jgi:hypothetical protein
MQQISVSEENHDRIVNDTIAQIDSIFKSITPTKKKMLAQEGYVTPKSAKHNQLIVDKIHESRETLKKNRDAKSLHVRKRLTDILVMPFFEESENETPPKNECELSDDFTKSKQMEILDQEPHQNQDECFQISKDVVQSLRPNVYRHLMIQAKTRRNIHPVILSEYAPVETSPNGDCVFNMISICLNGDESLSKRLRYLTHETMMMNNSFFSSVLARTDLCKQFTMEGLLKDCITDGAWCGEYHLLALSITIQRPIYIYTSQQRGGSFFDENINCSGAMEKLAKRDSKWRGHLEYRSPFISENDRKPVCGFFFQQHYTALLPRSSNSPLFVPCSNLFHPSIFPATAFEVVLRSSEDTEETDEPNGVSDAINCLDKQLNSEMDKNSAQSTKEATIQPTADTNKYKKIRKRGRFQMTKKLMRSRHRVSYKAMKKKTAVNIINCSIKKNLVKEFFKDESNVIYNPDRKKVSKKTGLPTVYCKKSLKAAHADFLNQHDTRMSFSTFYKLKPKNLKSQKTILWNQCLCETCENVALKIKAVKGVNPASSLQNKYHVAGLTLCEPHVSNNNRQCYERSCSKCSTQNLKQVLEQELCGKSEIQWKEWIDNDKKKNLIVKKSSTNAFIAQFCKNVEVLPHHLFTSDWQHKQYKASQRKIQEGDIVIGMDFSENYRTCYQNEIASAHFSYNQISIHPMVCWYKCPQENCHEIIKESIIGVADDLRKDAVAVNAFVGSARNHLITNRGINIKREIRWSDNCSAQYKSQRPFYTLSEENKEVSHNYFGSSHGKSQMDGEGAVVKNYVQNKIKSEACVVKTAGEFVAMFEATEDVDVHSRHGHKLPLRTVVLVDRMEDREYPKTKTLIGTHKMHCVQSMGERGYIKARNLSCMCDGCWSGKDEIPCDNMKFVDSFVVHQIVKDINTDIAKTDNTSKAPGDTHTRSDDMVPYKGTGTSLHTDSLNTNKDHTNTEMGHQDSPVVIGDSQR